MNNTLENLKAVREALEYSLMRHQHPDEWNMFKSAISTLDTLLPSRRRGVEQPAEETQFECRTDLVPCPFCGEKKLYLNRAKGGGINCPSCLTRMPNDCNDAEELIDCWNHREPERGIIPSQKQLASAEDLLDPDMPAQKLRLYCGELTAQEVRTARAVIRWANSIRTASQQQPASALVEALEKLKYPNAKQGSYMESGNSMVDACIAIARQHTRGPDTFDYHRVREWALSTPRKPANTAFTAGTDRNVAYLIEDLEDKHKPDVEAGARALAGIFFDDMGFSNGQQSRDDYISTKWQEFRKEAKACYLAAGWTVKE